MITRHELHRRWEMGSGAENSRLRDLPSESRDLPRIHVTFLLGIVPAGLRSPT